MSSKVTARSVYETSLFTDPDATDGVRRFIEAGEEARVVDRLPLKLVIIDETIVMFGMEDPVAGTDALTIVVVEHPSLAHVLKVAFEAILGQGLTFDEAAERYAGSHGSTRGGEPDEPRTPAVRSATARAGGAGSASRKRFFL